MHIGLMYDVTTCRLMVTTPEAMKDIQEFYLELRNISKGDTVLPITVRTLEAIIRLSTAAAKARLSVDIQQVGLLLFFAVIR